jgi:hypothetical protein
MRIKIILPILICLVLISATHAPFTTAASPVTYYVSSSSGSDGNNGLSSGAPFASVSKVNSLNLQPGDQVLFKCGDTWRAEQLVLSKSGSQAAPIRFSSYPAGCANKPVLSGSRPITGWVLDSGNVYRADLPAGTFPMGINQLFRNGQRLTLGRWPNLDDPNADYAFVDGHTSGSNQIVDNQLPAVDWTGAIVHIKNIRWSMLDRQVTATNGHTLTLNTGLSCLISGWADCVGWGYFINNNRNTLDEDGEWFYDANLRRVYMVSTGGIPANIEGSVVLEQGSDVRHGGMMLSDGGPTAYVIVDNLVVSNWFNHGVGTPGGMNGDIYHDITVQNVIIQNVNGAGVNLSSWLERPSDGQKGLRGGYNMVFSNDVIDGANSFGITGFFAQSTFENNTIQNVALIKNLGASGMGCGLTSNQCTENGDGLRILTYDLAHSGFGNLLWQNRFDKIGYNGVDVFGPENTLEENYITQACYTKADCGGVRTFGDTSLTATPVYNLHLIDNIIADIPGNVDGCHPSRAAFGMGLYIDNYSRDVETRGNTIVNTTVSGILYQQSSGVITGNTVFNASSGTEYSAQIDLSGSATRVTMSGNSLYGLNIKAWTLYTYNLSNILSSDHNYIFHPYINKHVAYGPSWTTQTFAQWQAFSGQDQHSKTNWFTQPAGETSRGKIYYNGSISPATIDLGSRQYLDLDQNPVAGSLYLPPFSSKILVDNGAATLLLKSIQPAMSGLSEAHDFTLLVSGVAFTASSVVRWSGVNRPTTYIDSTHLSAAITASDVSALGDYPVTVYDPQPAPSGTVTPPINFHVFPVVYLAHLPQVTR